MSDTPRIGHTEGGHSFVGGDPASPENWKKIGAVEDGHVFQGGDPAKKDNWAPHIVKDQEADLGIVNRAKYSIEPIQSNRKALLEEALGKDNVLQDSKGELFIKQNGAFHPVNKDGASAADAADFAGALPEMAGGAIGTAAGAIAGLGPASPATAVIGGAVGAGAGSAIRQGLSAAIGNPQVATAGERAAETGMSAAMGGAAGAAGHYLKPVLAKAKTGITQFIKGASKEAADTVGTTTSKTVAHTVSEAGGEMVPHYAPKAASEITGEVADQSEREMVKAEHKKLSEIAAQEGLPEPTYAQSAGGKALIAESKVLDMPLISGKIRSHVDKQLKFVRNNLEKLTGRKIDADSSAHEVGQATRDYAETAVESTKKAAQELYKQVEDEGAKAMISKTTLLKKWANHAADLGIINPDMTPRKYDATSGMTPETYAKLQDVFFKGINALKENKSGKVSFEAANGLTKFVKNTAQEMKASNPNGHRILSDFGKKLNSTMEGVLNREAPKLGEKFAAANANWAKYKGHEEVLKKIIRPGMSDEHIAKAVMSGTAKIADIKNIIGEGPTKEIAKSFVADIFQNLNKSGIGRADSAISALKKSEAQIRAAAGDDFYVSALNNLHYLNRTGQPLNVSRASLYNILDNRGEGLKSLTFKMLGTAQTVAQGKGTTITKAVKDKAIDATSKTVGSGANAINKNISGVANLLGDNLQRGASSYPSKSLQMVSDKNDEKSQRARIISGRRAGAK